MENDLVIIGQCSNSEVLILKSYFEAHEIFCHIQGEALINTTAGRLFMNIMVPHSQKEEAILLYDEFQKAAKESSEEPSSKKHRGISGWLHRLVGMR